MEARARGTLFALLSAVCFGTEAIFVKRAYASGVGALTISALRFVIAAAALSPWFLPYALRRGLRRRTWAAAIIIAATLLAPVTLLLVLALQRVPASVAIICFYVYPTLATLLAVPALGERLTAVKALALLGSFAGVAMVVGAPGALPDIGGIMLALLAAVINAVAVVAVKRELGDLPPLVATGAVLAFGAVAFVIVSAFARSPLVVPAAAAPHIVGVGLVSTAMALAFLYSGLGLIEASRVSIIATLEPIVTATLAAALLGERLAPLQAFGGLLVVGSVLFLSIHESDHN